LDTRIVHEMGARRDHPGRTNDRQYVRCLTCGGEHMIYRKDRKYSKPVVECVNGERFRTMKEVVIPGGMDICPTCVKRAEAEYRTMT